VLLFVEPLHEPVHLHDEALVVASLLLRAVLLLDLATLVGERPYRLLASLEPELHQRQLLVDPVEHRNEGTEGGL